MSAALIAGLIDEVVALRRRVEALEQIETWPKSNLDASAAPGVGDDENDGYNYGSFWLNRTANTFYVCADPASGAAVWVRLG